jgi:hypothetical protein
VLYWLSAALLASSVVAVLLNARSQLGTSFWYFAWVHIGVIIAGGYATIELRRISRKSPPPTNPRLWEIFGRPIIAAGVISIIAAAPNLSGASINAGLKSADGAPVSSMSVHEVGGRYYARVNHEPDREIPKAQYDEFNQAFFSMFARGWVLFSFIALCLWHVVILRLRPVEPGSTGAGAGEAGLSATAMPSTLESAVSAPPSSVSTLAIVGIWLAVLASSVLQFMQPIEPTMCTAQFPFPVIVALMPFVVFGFGAMRAKHSFFYSPWIAQIVDARYGAKSYERFLVRLKPMLLFAAGFLAIAATAMVQCGKSVTDLYEAMMPTFFVSCGAAFVLMHFLMRWRKLPGV